MSVLDLLALTAGFPSGSTLPFTVPADGWELAYSAGLYHWEVRR